MGQAARARAECANETPIYGISASRGAGLSAMPPGAPQHATPDDNRKCAAAGRRRIAQRLRIAWKIGAGSAAQTHRRGRGWRAVCGGGNAGGAGWDFYARAPYFAMHKVCAPCPRAARRMLTAPPSRPQAQAAPRPTRRIHSGSPFAARASAHSLRANNRRAAGAQLVRTASPTPVRQLIFDAPKAHLPSAASLPASQCGSVQGLARRPAGRTAHRSPGACAWTPLAFAAKPKLTSRRAGTPCSVGFPAQDSTSRAWSWFERCAVRARPPT